MTTSAIIALESWVDVFSQLGVRYLLWCEDIAKKLSQSEDFRRFKARVNNSPRAMAALNDLSHRTVRDPRLTPANIQFLAEMIQSRSCASALHTTEAAGRSQNPLATTEPLHAAPNQANRPFGERGDPLTKLIRKISLEKSKLSLDRTLTALLRHEEFGCETASRAPTSKKSRIEFISYDRSNGESHTISRKDLTDRIYRVRKKEIALSRFRSR